MQAPAAMNAAAVNITVAASSRTAFTVLEKLARIRFELEVPINLSAPQAIRAASNLSGIAINPGSPMLAQVNVLWKGLGLE